MKPTLAILVLTCLVASVASADVNLLALVKGTPLTEAEMEIIDGSLLIFGVEIFPRIRRLRRTQTTSDPQAVQCDVIAQNQADNLGLDTRSQDGNAVDYNNATVADIYDGYPNNRSTTPPEGSSGYYFTSYSSGKEHMGVYQRQTGSDSYTRYSNASYAGTEQAYQASADYLPPRVTGQVFIPLPSYEYYDLYYR